jgi:hypothetical protein
MPPRWPTNTPPLEGSCYSAHSGWQAPPQEEFDIDISGDEFFISHCRAAKEEAIIAGTKWNDRKFQYSSNSSNSTLQPHIEKYHLSLYKKLALDRGWKIQLPHLMSQVRSASSITDAVSEDLSDKFSETLFHEYLIKFIVTDDQVRAYMIYWYSSSLLFTFIVFKC